jgi:hypothetical protein
MSDTTELDEQAERIRENLALYQASAQYEYTFQEYEEIFEDRDPFEFL